MTEINNSQRHFYKATYAPIRLDPSGDDMKKHMRMTRCFEKLSFVQSLAIRPAEISSLRACIVGDTTNDSNVRQLHEVLNIVENIGGNPSPSALLLNVNRFKDVDMQTLVQFGKLLAENRHAQSKEVESSLGQIRMQYMAALERSTTLAANIPQSPASVTIPIETSAHASRLTSSDEISQPPEGSVDEGASDLSPSIVAAARTPMLAGQVRASIGQFQRVIPPLENAIEWAATNAKHLFEPLHSRALNLAPISTIYSNVGPAALVAILSQTMAYWAEYTIELVNGFEERLPIEPVGRLHLERLEMTPAGVERGELLYSVPLSPKETVNIAHKEWATKSEEFEKIIQDSFEGYSEEGVAEKNDIAMSTESQSKHSNTMNLSTSVSGTYFGTTISTSFGYSQTSDDQQAKKDSRNHSVETTRKASSRTRKEHKTTFKVSSVAGTEDLAVRTITNPSETDVMRVDYFSMMRKWRVDLYRYDLRMTYDIVIPNPGADLMRKVEELRALDALLEKPFEFPLKVAEIRKTTWRDYAALYHANVEGPLADSTDNPPPKMHFHKEWVNSLQDQSWANHMLFDMLEFEVDSNYFIIDGTFRISFDVIKKKMDDNVYVIDISQQDIHEADFIGNLPGETFTTPIRGEVPTKTPVERTIGLTSLINQSGKLSINWGTMNILSGSVDVDLSLELTEAAFKDWQLKAWNAMREAAEEIYQQNQQAYKERREQLAAELSASDTLTLRQMEREEIMKGVLRWLFGPQFTFAPADIKNLFTPIDPKDPMSLNSLFRDPNSPTNATWKQVLEFGEFIKYLHHAIEWENLLYILYPYFWDSLNADKKRFLDHPDPLHREFLRAGCARVVLTIRPGFEDSFTTKVETGAFGKLPTEHPYVSIAQEIANYAQTNYPGIPPANPTQNARPLLYPKQQKAWSEMQQIIELLNVYNQKNGRFPSTSEGLDALQSHVSGTATKVPTQDPWGNKYIYTSPGIHGDYDLVSYGADGNPDGTDENADITSWADANLIGTWYEYTPTSALDISINTEPANMG
jgi:type II secretion system protein G